MWLAPETGAYTNYYLPLAYTQLGTGLALDLSGSACLAGVGDAWGAWGWRRGRWRHWRAPGFRHRIHACEAVLVPCETSRDPPVREADGMDLWPLSLERRRRSGSSAVSTQVGSYGSRVTCLRPAEFELVKLPFRRESAIGRRARA